MVVLLGSEHSGWLARIGPAFLLAKSSIWRTLRTGAMAMNSGEHYKAVQIDITSYISKDWAILELGHSGKVSEIKIDTHHFEGNFLESAINEGANIASSDSKLAETNSDKVTHVRVTMFPDGGISRSSWIGANPLMPIHFHVYKLLFGQEDLFTTFIRDLTFLSPLMDEDT
ncbi:allantoicase [Powellomyces hirtus]|uniref:Allantoicase n=1 Tax=Powellomyces hirtus TaxID=109895 RepID=A0A507E6D5_9FUNG|nr:allantoicase [Powellomyces hirtus]